jgi:glycosyltransferase involved in cell wall biosynthesis
MTRPLISVVIPAYNHERFVGIAIESVLKQTCSDFELIVVDDGSTDNSAEVINSYSDSRLHYYFQENQDAFNTINRGIELARGRYISILNSDDVYTLDRLENLLEVCQKGTAVCAFSDVMPIDDDDKQFTDPAFGWNVWHRKNRGFYFDCQDLFTAFLKGNFMVTTSNLFMETEAARQVGPFCSLRYLHDYDFIFRMISRFPEQVCYLDDQKLLYYRIHSGNTLGEAAITGREQDKQLISKFMLGAIPAPYRNYVQAGSERLVELENELAELRNQLQPDGAKGVRPALKELAQATQSWVKKRVS